MLNYAFEHPMNGEITHQLLGNKLSQCKINELLNLKNSLKYIIKFFVTNF